MSYYGSYSGYSAYCGGHTGSGPDYLSAYYSARSAYESDLSARRAHESDLRALSAPFASSVGSYSSYSGYISTFPDDVWTPAAAKEIKAKFNFLINERKRLRALDDARNGFAEESEGGCRGFFTKLSERVAQSTEDKKLHKIIGREYAMSYSGDRYARYYIEKKYCVGIVSGRYRPVYPVKQAPLSYDHAPADAPAWVKIGAEWVRPHPAFNVKPLPPENLISPDYKVPGDPSRWDLTDKEWQEEFEKVKTWYDVA